MRAAVVVAFSTLLVMGALSGEAAFAMKRGLPGGAGDPLVSAAVVAPVANEGSRIDGGPVIARRGGRTPEPTIQETAAQPVPESEGPAGASPGFTDPGEGGLEVTLGEWAVILEAAVIRPGPVTFAVRNRGIRYHGFRIRSESARGRDRLEARTPLIAPGGEATLTVNLPAGAYRADCYVEEADVGDHAGLGMRTRLTVSPDAPLVRPVQTSPSPTVIIERFSFAPSVLTVRRGATVVWKNNDPAPHTVTADDGSFDSGTMPGGGEFRHRFDSPGVFAYKCLIHPAMKATVRVE